MATCPRDHSVLVLQEVRGSSLHRCPKCSGVWLPPQVVATAIGRVPRPSLLELKAEPTPLVCPDDGAGLAVFRSHGVEADLCTRCSGVWLDPGELARISSKRAEHTAKDHGGRVASVFEAVNAASLPVDLLWLLGEFLSIL